MTTSNLPDLSSFDPEAILGSLPGEHPRMAAGLAIGREASEGGRVNSMLAATNGKRLRYNDLIAE